MYLAGFSVRAIPCGLWLPSIASGMYGVCLFLLAVLSPYVWKYQRTVTSLYVCKHHPEALPEELPPTSFRMEAVKEIEKAYHYELCRRQIGRGIHQFFGKDIGEVVLGKLDACTKCRVLGAYDTTR